MAKDSDFNDLGKAKGLSLVKNKVDSAVKAEKGVPYGRYIVKLDGVYMQVENKDDTVEEVYFCTRLAPVGIARSSNGDNFTLVLELTDLDRQKKTWVLSQEQIYKSGGEEARIQFVNLGGCFAPNTRERSQFVDLMKSFCRQSGTLPRITLADRSGWINKDQHYAYVMPEDTIGALGEENVLLPNPGDGAPNYSMSGTLDQWRQQIGRLCVGNSRLVFAVSLPLAGALLAPTGVEGGGFNIIGNSGDGKTTTMHVAASATGPPRQQIKTCDNTANAFESTAAQHNDACLLMDELGQAPPEQIGQIVYKLAGGVGRGRADQHGNARTRRQWKISFLTTGETDLGTMLASVGKRSFAGQELRLADIPADADRDMGVFEKLHELESPAKLADHLKAASSQFHGSLFNAYITKLVDEMNNPEQRAARLGWISEAQQHFAQAIIPAAASGQVHRVASRFALVAVGGELATLYGLTGWRAGEAMDAAMICFEAWLQRRGTAGQAEVEQFLRQVSAFFELHGESRFTLMGRKNKPTVNRAGFRNNVAEFSAEEEYEYFVFPSAYNDEICKGFDPRWCTQVLIEKGLLKPGPGGKASISRRLPGVGKTTRCYHFPAPTENSDTE
ncbi:DUF927 domain-containing protein [uncultured Desulfuromonas sp.]|uniref:DUF927 domain-containing protein n=1 Tax=uncultured Desulfuromonas sp. TaxID=181013 RepID=UPI002AAAE196|nr:DUF927 domain-containing protein [uncultured Desulfuromonas sp.]